MIRPQRREPLGHDLQPAALLAAHQAQAHDIVADRARRAGAVNTLVFREGRINGSNTDGYGFVANLRALNSHLGRGS